MESSKTAYSATIFKGASLEPAVRAEDLAQNVINSLCASTGNEAAGQYPHKILSHDSRVLQISFQSSASIESIRSLALIQELEAACDIQVVVQPKRVGKPPSLRLAVFDMDSTLIQQEVIDLLAAQAGVEAQVANITSRAMNGELDFSESLRERVALLQGIPSSVFEELKPKLTLVPGAQKLLRCLKALGVKTAVLSGGFMPLATYIADKLEIDYVHANELATEHDAFTGKLLPECVIVNAERKRDLLREIATGLGLTDKSQIMAIGDGANDLLMLAEAGLGIAVNAKPKVQQLAPCKLNCESIDDILFVLGLTSDDVNAVL